MKPALETMGVEYPDMATLNISTPKTPTNPTPTTPTPPSGTIGEITIVTTNVSQFEYGYTTVDFNLTNGINASIYLDDVIVTFNGKDISDDSIIFIEAKKGETVEDDFFVPVEIKSGDTLTISGTIINDDTFETLGTITLPMTFK